MHAATLDPILAVTARNPYAYYASLVSERPFYYDGGLRLWVASSAAAAQAVLSCPALRVRPPRELVPRALVGSPIESIFVRLIRMTDGDYHDAAKTAAVRTLEGFGLERVRKAARAAALALRGTELETYIFGVPAMTIALLLGLQTEAARDAIAATQSFARAISASASAQDVANAIPLTKTLVARLNPLCRDPANAIGFLFQSYDATAGLIANTLLHWSRNDAATPLGDLVRHVARSNSPVQNTRRYAAVNVTILGQNVREGDTILVLLAAANCDPANADCRLYTFGAGPHACPGAQIALTIAEAAVQQLLDNRLDPPSLRFNGYRPSPNLRIANMTQGHLLNAPRKT